MYCFLPLVVFKYRKGLQSIVRSTSKTKNKPAEIKKESQALVDTIKQLNSEIKKLIEGKLIKLTDLHTMLLAITNLTHYLNHKFIKDTNLTGEVIKMTKTLYDPAVEQRGIEQGIEQGRVEVAKSLLDILDNETIALKTKLSIEQVEQLRFENK
ncbi:hypothetical protein AN641_05620 [Candidatus Epulonipiscioides gigas]|nr:hypothetical protein AN641_07740 [Epulopiscium sp. SCG-C07WGA-EpuloA2]ONI44860.1 hypothetical protein AN641_05620 [Epulopiscium sp. SCG-C07WGA-EpuloA2]